MPDPSHTADRLRDARVLVTGGLGFIGSHLALALAEAGAHVAVLDNEDPCGGANRFNLARARGLIELHEGNVADATLVTRLVDGVDVVFDLAGRTSHLDSMRDPLADLAANCTGPLTVLEACRHRRPHAVVVFTSTRQLYGRPRGLPVDEDHPITPVDINGVHKAAAEGYHALYHTVYGLRTRRLRLTNTYGPHQRLRDGRQSFLGAWLRCLLTRAPIEVWGGAQRRDFTYVDDAIDALIRLATSDAADGQVYNLGGDAPARLDALAELMVHTYGAGSWEVRDFPPERAAIDIGDFHADTRRLRDATGWAPRVPLTEGIARTIDFYRKHGQHYL